MRGATHTSHWFHRIESANDFVVYVADPTRDCMEQSVRSPGRCADAARARGQRSPDRGPRLRAARESELAPQRAELVLLHDGAIPHGAAARWLDAQPGIAHHHVTGPQDVPQWRGC